MSDNGDGDNDSENFGDNIVAESLLYALYGVLALATVIVLGLTLKCIYETTLKPWLKYCMKGLKRRLYFCMVNMRYFNRKQNKDEEIDCGTFSGGDLINHKLDAYKYKRVIITREAVDDYSNVGTTRLCKLSVKEFRVPDFDEVKLSETCCICLESLQLKLNKDIHPKKKSGMAKIGLRRAHNDEDREAVCEKVVQLPCQHFFHKKCLKEWFEPKKRRIRKLIFCPLCRMDLMKCKYICMELGLPVEDVRVTSNGQKAF